MEFRWKNELGGYHMVDAAYATLKDDGSIYLPKSDAVKLAREVLRFYGAPLEEPKPEPQKGQVWRIGEHRVVVTSTEVDWILLMRADGLTGGTSALTFKEQYEFVAESWAGEEK